MTNLTGLTLYPPFNPDARCPKCGSPHIRTLFLESKHEAARAAAEAEQARYEARKAEREARRKAREDWEALPWIKRRRTPEPPYSLLAGYYSYPRFDVPSMATILETDLMERRCPLCEHHWYEMPLSDDTNG